MIQKLSERFAPVATTLIGVAVLLATGSSCSSSGNASDVTDASEGAIADARPPNPDSSDAPPGDPGFVILIETAWTRPPMSEGYFCAWVTIEDDMYITGFEPMAPTGTQFMALSVLDAYEGPDKAENCNFGTIGDRLLFSSGVGTDAFALPVGIAMKVNAGNTLLLNLHLLNPASVIWEATSGVKVTTSTPVATDNLAEFFWTGTMVINIPASESATASGYCTMQTGGNVFAVGAFMRQLGTRMEFDTPNATLLDTLFDFNEHEIYSVVPTPVTKGEKITATCHWSNDTASPVYFGDYLDDEMCFGGIYRYPVSGVVPVCVNN